MTSSSRCPYCGNEYPMIMIPGLFGKDGRAVRSTVCGCEGETEALALRSREALQAQLSKAWHNTGVPKMYWDVTPDKRTLGELSGRGLYLSGPMGTGKTTAACRVLKAYVAQNQSDGYVSARFLSVPAWLASMRQGWGSVEEDAFQRAAGVRFLVLDDIGKGKPTEWAMERLFRLVDERYTGLRQTVLTSQYELSELGGRCAANGDPETAEAMVSRIHHMCEPRRLTGPDLRLS